MHQRWIGLDFYPTCEHRVCSTGKLTISTTNDYASSTLGSAIAGGAIGGTLTSAVTFTIATAPVVDISAQAVRSNLVTQFNGILSQITTTAQDASFNGINLLDASSRQQLERTTELRSDGAMR